LFELAILLRYVFKESPEMNFDVNYVINSFIDSFIHYVIINK